MLDPTKFDRLTSDFQPATPTPNMVMLIVPVHVDPGATVDEPVIVDGAEMFSRFSAAAAADGAAALAAGRGAVVVVGSSEVVAFGDTTGAVVGNPIVGTASKVWGGVVVGLALVVGTAAGGSTVSVVAICVGVWVGAGVV